ncbi:MAG: hypothetical protein ACOC5T_05895 [Elusimicrobiota bacterium]
MTRQKKESNALVVYDGDSLVIPNKYKKPIQKSLMAFLDASSTSMGRKTFYNTKNEQDDALGKIHKSVFSINRGLYTSMLLLPGVTDLSRTMGIHCLLQQGYNNDEEFFLTSDEEKIIINELLASMPVTRVLRLFEDLKKQRVNNRRTRTIISRFVLGNDNFVFWSVKYRKKIRDMLVHAIGYRQTSALKTILQKQNVERTSKERSFIQKSIDRYLPFGINKKHIYDAICFVLGGTKENWGAPLIRSFFEARESIEKGKNLPAEVLEGIRSKYHSDVSSAEVMKLTQDNMSEKKKMQVQKSAKKKNVEIEFNPMKQGVVDLYIHAFETGMTNEIKKALKIKAKKASANNLVMAHEHVGVVVDCSRSMRGDRTQKHRPISIALAMRDMLRESANKATIKSSHGKTIKNCIPSIQNETSLSQSLVDVLIEKPDTVYLITDGYENSPAGRVAEVIKRVREMGNNTPIYQISPVMGAESAGIRSVSSEIEPLPVSRPEGMGLALIRSAISQGSLEDGIEGLLTIAKKELKRIESKK